MVNDVHSTVTSVDSIRTPCTCTFNLQQLRHKIKCMWCRQPFWVAKSTMFSMAVSHNLCSDQPELSMYVNYLTA